MGWVCGPTVLSLRQRDLYHIKKCGGKETCSKTDTDFMGWTVVKEETDRGSLEQRVDHPRTETQVRDTVTTTGTRPRKPL